MHSLQVKFPLEVEHEIFLRFQIVDSKISHEFRSESKYCAKGLIFGKRVRTMRFSRSESIQKAGSAQGQGESLAHCASVLSGNGTRVYVAGIS